MRATAVAVPIWVGAKTTIRIEVECTGRTVGPYNRARCFPADHFLECLIIRKSAFSGFLFFFAVHSVHCDIWEFACLSTDEVGQSVLRISTILMAIIRRRLYFNVLLWPALMCGSDDCDSPPLRPSLLISRLSQSSSAPIALRCKICCACRCISGRNPP